MEYFEEVTKVGSQSIELHAYTSHLCESQKMYHHEQCRQWWQHCFQNNVPVWEVSARVQMRGEKEQALVPVMHKWRSRIFIVMVTIRHCHESSNFKNLNLDTLYNGHWGSYDRKICWHWIISLIIFGHVQSF